LFAELFGIRPWEWDHLSAVEVYSLISYIEAREKASDG